jgi:pilus assembly protein Flp/PilA
MKSLKEKLARFLRTDDGPTAVEYAVMLSLIVVMCITAVATMGKNANQTYSFVGSKVKG